MKKIISLLGLFLLLNWVNAQTTFTINAHNKKQKIHDFGASGCWNSENIGKYWAEEKKNRIAELLFSKDVDSQGNPKGIALSCYRFNIGGGTAEQGEKSGIPDPNRRAECFLDSTGKYDYTKQSGYQWFLKKAKEYQVPTLIAFVNTPPVFMNQNGLGYKSNKDGHTNLKANKYADFADFLANVLNHFESEGIHFEYLSPINEPQWGWEVDDKGKCSQEGCPYFNSEIAAVVRKIDSVFTQKKVKTPLFITEAGAIDRLFQGNAWADNQIENFWNPKSENYLGNLKNFEKNIVSGHSYWTEPTTEKMIENRQKLFEKLQATDKKLEFWQTEYSFLGDGFKEGEKKRRSQIDCALFLAKIIHHDLTLVNARAWQFWTAIDPTPPNHEIRYNLIYANEKDQVFSDTKSLWALGNYSRFVRPDMVRIETQRNDNLTLVQAANKLMLSAYVDEKTQKLVVVAINYDTNSQEIKLNLENFTTNSMSFIPYVTSATDNLKPYPKITTNSISLSPRSITTLISE